MKKLRITRTQRIAIHVGGALFGLFALSCSFTNVPVLVTFSKLTAFAYFLSIFVVHFCTEIDPWSS